MSSTLGVKTLGEKAVRHEIAPQSQRGEISCCRNWPVSRLDAFGVIFRLEGRCIRHNPPAETENEIEGPKVMIPGTQPFQAALEAP